VLLAKVEIVGVVCGCQLYSSSTEFRIHVVICDNGHETINEGVLGLLSYEMLIAIILGMDSDTRVAQHSFRTGGSDLDELVCAFNGVLERTLVYNLCITIVPHIP